MMRQELHQTMESVISSPKTAQIVATATASLGAAEALDLVRSGLSLLALAVGLCLSVMLFIKHRYEYRVSKARRAEELLDREEQGLPVRRVTDRVD